MTGPDSPNRYSTWPGMNLAIPIILAGFVVSNAYAEVCGVAPMLPLRADHDSDLVICGDEMPADIVLDGLSEAGIELVYRQALKECNWDDERPGFHLVLRSQSPAEGISIDVRDAESGREVCELTVDFLPAQKVEEPYWLNSMPEESVKTVDVDGINTRYFESGEGPPLILVHGGQTGGFNNHARKWEQNFPGLAENFRVISLDRLGQGGTDNLKRLEDYPNYYSLDAQHLEGFIDALGLTDVTLVGHSQGGWPVTRVALDRPDLVSCLVNVGTVMVPDDGDMMLDALNFVSYVAGPVHPDSGPTYYSSRRAILLRYPTGNNVTEVMAQRVVDQHASPKIQEAVKGMSSLPPNPQHPTLRLNPAHPIFGALRTQAHEDIAAGGLQVRSLVIFGEKDLQVPVGLGQMFNQMLEESGVETSMVIVKDAGHSPHAEFPDQFNEIVTDYCGRDGWEAAGASQFSHATVGVRDLTAALKLWTDTFGMQLVAQSEGPDPSLSRLWQIPTDAVARQALVRAPGRNKAGLHLVEFREPGEAVIADSTKIDWGPKSLVIYGSDLPERLNELRAAGHLFGDPAWLEFAAGPKLTVREVRMRTHDETSVMLVEHVGVDHGFGEQTYVGIGRLVTVVPDAEREAEFLREMLNLDEISKASISGPELEETFGYPPGTVLNIAIVGDKSSPLGRVEAAERKDTIGRDLFKRAIPPATGLLHVTYRVADLDEFVQRLQSTGTAFVSHERVSAIYGDGPMISFHSPAGLRIEAQQIVH